jgi:hypothetical protein
MDIRTTALLYAVRNHKAADEEFDLSTFIEYLLGIREDLTNWPLKMVSEEAAQREIRAFFEDYLENCPAIRIPRRVPRGTTRSRRER